MTVTRAELDALRAGLLPYARPQLTPEGYLTVNVHRELDRKNRKRLHEGETSMHAMQEQLRRDLAYVRNQGLERAQFNHRAAQDQNALTADSGSTKNPSHRPLYNQISGHSY